MGLNPTVLRLHLQSVVHVLLQGVNSNPLIGTHPIYCVHPAEDSDDKECGSFPKMINDLLLSEEEKTQVSQFSIIRLGSTTCALNISTASVIFLTNYSNFGTFRVVVPVGYEGQSLVAGFDDDSTPIRPRYAHSTTYVTTVGLPGRGLLHRVPHR